MLVLGGAGRGQGPQGLGGVLRVDPAERRRPALGARVPGDRLTVLAGEEGAGGDSAHERAQPIHRRLPHLGVPGGEIDAGHDPGAGGEQPMGQRLLHARHAVRGVLPEVLHVAAEVEDAEPGLVDPVSVDVRAQPGTATDHLPELGLGEDLLEQHQVQHLGHVDAGVEHVHADRDVRGPVADREGLDEVLRVGGIAGDHLGEVPAQVRVLGVEALLEELGVALVHREHDGLAQTVAAGHVVAGAHQLGEGLVRGVGVEQGAEHARCLDRGGHLLQRV